MTTWTPPSAVELEQKIREMVDRIVAGFHPEKVILYGSRARGDAAPDSDVDLLVVIETESKKQTTRAIRMALGAMGIPKDVVVIRPREFEELKDVAGTIAYPAHREGRTLYERR